MNSRITLVLFRTRRRDEYVRLKEGVGRRVLTGDPETDQSDRTPVRREIWRHADISVLIRCR